MCVCVREGGGRATAAEIRSLLGWLGAWRLPERQAASGGAGSAQRLARQLHGCTRGAAMGGRLVVLLWWRALLCAHSAFELISSSCVLVLLGSVDSFRGFKGGQARTEHYLTSSCFPFSSQSTSSNAPANHLQPRNVFTIFPSDSQSAAGIVRPSVQAHSVNANIQT